jgi:8-oxo-dGTP diphosphatase
LRSSIARELAEEAGVDRCEIVRLVGVFSRLDRDPRLHAVTILVECRIGPLLREPSNPLEITEARLFAPADLPRWLAMGMHEMLRAAMDGRSGVLE